MLTSDNSNTSGAHRTANGLVTLPTPTHLPRNCLTSTLIGQGAYHSFAKSTMSLSRLDALLCLSLNRLGRHRSSLSSSITSNLNTHHDDPSNKKLGTYRKFIRIRGIRYLRPKLCTCRTTSRTLDFIGPLPITPLNRLLYKRRFVGGLPINLFVDTHFSGL